MLRPGGSRSIPSRSIPLRRRPSLLDWRHEHPLLPRPRARRADDRRRRRRSGEGLPGRAAGGGVGRVRLRGLERRRLRRARGPERLQEADAAHARPPVRGRAGARRPGRRRRLLAGDDRRTWAARLQPRRVAPHPGVARAGATGGVRRRVPARRRRRPARGAGRRRRPLGGRRRRLRRRQGDARPPDDGRCTSAGRCTGSTARGLRVRSAPRRDRRARGVRDPPDVVRLSVAYQQLDLSLLLEEDVAG